METDTIAKHSSPYLLRVDANGNLELAWSKGLSKRKRWLQKPRITQIGFISSVGDPGCGKTVLLHRILKDLRKFKSVRYPEDLSANTSGILLTPTPAVVSLPGDDDNAQTDVYCLDLNCYSRDNDRFPVLFEYCVKLSSVVILVVDQTSKRNVQKSLKKLSTLNRGGKSVALVILRFWPTEKQDGSTFSSSLMDGLEFLNAANRQDSQTDDAAEFVEDVMQVFWNVHVSFPRSPDLNDLTLTGVGSKTGSWSKYLHRPFSVGLEEANYVNIQKLLSSTLSGMRLQNLQGGRENQIPSTTSIPQRLSDKRRRYLADMLLHQSQSPIEHQQGKSTEADSLPENLPSFESVSSGFPDDFGSLENTSTEWSFAAGDSLEMTTELENAFELDRIDSASSEKEVEAESYEKVQENPGTDADDEGNVRILQLEFLKIELQVAMDLDEAIDDKRERKETRSLKIPSMTSKSMEEISKLGLEVQGGLQNEFIKFCNDVSRITTAVVRFQQTLSQEILDFACVDSNRLRVLEAKISLDVKSLRVECEPENERLKEILEKALRRSYNCFKNENEIRIAVEKLRLAEALNIIRINYEEFMSGALVESVFSDNNLKQLHEKLVQIVTDPAKYKLPTNFVWTSYKKQIRDTLGAIFEKFHAKNHQNVRELENARKSVLQACFEAFTKVGGRGASIEYREDFMWNLFHNMTKNRNPPHVELWKNELEQALPSLEADYTSAAVVNYSSDSDYEPKLRRKATARDLEKVMERLSATLDAATSVPELVEEYARKRIHASTELLHRAGSIDFQIQNSIQQLEMIQDKVTEDYW